MGNVWRIIRACLRRSWTDALLLGLLLFLMTALLVGRADETRGWVWFDSVRLVVIVTVATGTFLSNRLVLSLPVSRDELWRARWWLATVGTTSLAALVRLVAQVVFFHHFGRCCGPIEFQQDAVLAVVDGLTAAACMGCVALALRPPAPAEARWRARVLRWLAIGVGISMPLWCPSLRAHLIRGDITLTSTDADALVVLAILTVVGFLLTPRLLSVDDRRPLVSASNPAASVVRLDHTRPRSKAQAGVGARAWAGRELALALSSGVGAVVASGVALGIAFVVGSVAAPWWQGIVALYLPGQIAAPVLPAVLAFFCAKRVPARLSMLRQVPISSWTIAAVLNAGPLVVLAAAWGTEAVTYRAAFGAWPPYVHLRVLAALGAIVMLAKTAALVTDSASLTAVVGVVMALSLSRLLPFSVGPGAAAAGALGLVLCLMWIDLEILTRARGAYRARVAVA